VILSVVRLVPRVGYERSLTLRAFSTSVLSAMKVTEALVENDPGEITDPQFQMESAVTAPVSGHIKRVVVQEGVYLDQTNTLPKS